MAAILICSSRDGDPGEPRRLWADAYMAVNSATLYAPDVDVVHAWQGPCEPTEVLENPRLTRVRQPDGCATYGEAFGYASTCTRADELILMNDDAVLLPDTVDVLLADVALLREHGGVRPGFVACRSNWVPGAQNVRVPNEGALAGNGLRYDSEDRILPAARVSPIVAWISREALDAIGGFPPLNWYSDDLMCFDLLAKGYTNFVSRSYVHHVGQRTTTGGGVTMEDRDREARAWIETHRPDFWAVLTGRAEAPASTRR